MKFEQQPWKQDLPKPALEERSGGIPAAWLTGMAARTVGSAIAGALLFALLIGPFLKGPLGLGPWAESRWNWVLAGAGVGAVFGAIRGLLEIARRSKTRSLAASLSLHYAESGDQQAEERLKTILAREGFVSLENVMVGQYDGAQLLVGDVVVVRHGSESNSRQKRTVAFFEELPVTFPRFCARPEGRLLNVLTELVGVEDIDFEDHEEFSRRYHLSGDSPRTIRQLFQPRLLDLITSLPPREIRGEKNCLAVATVRGALGAGELQQFIDEANRLRRELEAASAEVSRMTPPVADEQLEPPRGLLGSLVRQSQTSEPEIQRFLASPRPREVPRKILRQYLGGSVWALILFFGIFAAMGSLFVGVGLVNQEWLFGLIGGVFATIGYVALPVTLWARRTKFRLLQDGQLTNGRIEEVRRTNVAVNNQQRYLATVSYVADGRPRTTEIPLYGAHVELAREAAEAGSEVPLLYDAGNPERAMLALQLQTDVALRL